MSAYPDLEWGEYESATAPDLTDRPDHDDAAGLDDLPAVDREQSQALMGELVRLQGWVA